MKKRIFAASLGLLLISGPGFAATTSCLGDTPEEIQQALHTLDKMPDEMNGKFTMKLKIDECIDCVRMINRELSRISGVSASNFDPQTKHIEIATTRPVPSHEILLLIGLAGYGSDFVDSIVNRAEVGPPEVSPVRD